MRSNMLTAIIKSTTRCNYRCKYCFVNADTSGEDMTLGTLRTTIHKLLSTANDSAVRFIWHGGEPLLCGLEFFDSVVALQREFNTQNKECTNAIQTNGSLLDDETIDFLKKNHFRIGLSLDGPRELNDVIRLRGRDAGTYDTTIERVRLLREHGLTTGAIATITRHNCHYPAELFRLFKENGLHMKLGQLVNSGRAKSNTEELGLLPEEYGEFAVQLFDLWLNDDEGITRIDPFESIVQSMLKPGARPTECIHAGRCHEMFICVSPNGDLYPCGLFHGHGDFCYGNICDLSLDRIEETPAYRILQFRQDVINDSCGNCPFFQYCHGGCPFSAFSNTGDILSRDYYCEGFRMVFRHVAERYKAALDPSDALDKFRIVCGGGGGGGGEYGRYCVDYSVDWREYPVYSEFIA